MSSARLSLPSLVIGLAAVLTIAARAAAEPVPAVPTADAATLGLWKFQEGQGDRVACEGKAPAGKIHGAEWVPGRDGFALATQAGWMDIPDDPALRPEKAITVEVWAKLAKGSGDLICKNGGYLLRLHDTLGGVIYTADGKSLTVQGSQPLPLGRWTHLALTYDAATKTASLYIDGKLDAAKQFDVPNASISQKTYKLRIGTNDWAPDGSQVDGKVAMLRISNVARKFEPPAAAKEEEKLPEGNLAANGNFEMGLQNWRVQGEGDTTLYWGVDSADVPSGRFCLKHLDGKETLMSSPIRVQPGAAYTFSARLRATVRQWPRVEIVGVGMGGSKPVLPPFPLYPGADKQWAQVTQTFVVPKDFASPSVSICISPPSSGEMWVDDVRLVAGDKADALTLQDQIAVGPKSSSIPVGNLIVAGSKKPLALSIVNTDKAAHRVTVRAVAVDWEKKPLPPVEVGAFDVPAGGAKDAELIIDASRRGNMRLGFELTSEGQTWRQRGDFKYVVIVPMKGVGSAEESMFAMNTHMEREPTPHLARNMEVLAQCGVKWIRAWWGWGMCEKEQGKYDWTEFDRQYQTVADAKMQIMPILLRYYSEHEQAWAGPLTKGAIQEYPKVEMLPKWRDFCGEVAKRYKGRITAYEIWNEPTMGSRPHGILTPQQYADLLKHSSPIIRKNDPKAKIVGFAGVPTDFLKDTLKLGVLPLMDVVADHSYSDLPQPEVLLTKTMAEWRKILAEAGRPDMPIWHTEQGMGADDEGFNAMALSEAELAALFIRDLIVANASGVEKFFWFSAQTSAGYSYAVYYENYIPRPHLTALNACASFLEGLKFRKSFQPGRNAQVHLYEGVKPTCVLWNMNMPARCVLPLPMDSVEAFDLMGNPVAIVAEKGGAAVELPTECPMYLRSRSGDAGALEKALAAAQWTDLSPVEVKARPVAGGMEVIVTSRSNALQDGVIEMAPSAGAAAKDRPTQAFFHSLAPGESRTIKLAVPAGMGEGRLRVRIGDRLMHEVRAAPGR